MTNYLTQAQYRAQKAALTRAVNAAKRNANPAFIEAQVRATVDQWNDGGYAWPDDWHRWQRALDDSRPWNAPYIDIQSI